MVLSCNKYEKQEIDWFNMIVSQDPTVLSVIVTAKDMIEKCLNCKSISVWCWSTADFVRFLDSNYSDETKRKISENDWRVESGENCDKK